MDLQTTLDVPETILAGLLKGDLIRRGGVIQRAAETPQAGQIVMWLREAGAAPAVPQSLASVSGAAGQVLGMVGPIASVLNLGVTVAFGVALYHELSAVEKRLAQMNDKIDRLQWTVEVGFVTVLNSVATLADYLEIEMNAKMTSAARLAWDAQLLEPGHLHRVNQLGHALDNATNALEQLKAHLQLETEAAIAWLDKQPPKARLAIPPLVTQALRRLRQTCIACALRAAIEGETGGNLHATANQLEGETAVLRDRLTRLGSSFVHGGASESTDENSVYADLLDSFLAKAVPITRLETWAQRFDPKIGGLAGILEMWRKRDSESRLVEPLARLEYREPGLWSSVSTWNKNLFKRSIDIDRQRLVEERKSRLKAWDNVPQFADLLDGAYEDVDRLGGYVAEYQTASVEGLSLQRYRDALAIRDTTEGRDFLFFVRKAG